MKEIIHFTHGNGFPSPCYRQMLLELQTKFDCCYIDRVGHQPELPVSDNWQSLAQEVIDSVQSQTSQPVIGVGHSLGGILTLLASIQQPKLFKMVILLDAPLFGPFKSMLLKCFKVMGLIDRVTPAFRAGARREHWSTREEVWLYLRSRKLFSTFSEACLNDYIDYGMDKHAEGYSLRFDREIESQIYRTIPHLLHTEEKLPRPTALLYGTQSEYVNKHTLRYMKKRYGIVDFKLSGTHMFPMESPHSTANIIMKAVEVLDLSHR